MLDRNKTQLTHDVTAAAREWLDAKGFKPIETEVTVTDGWCADLAAVIVPTTTELIDLKLLGRKPSWKHEQAQDAAWTDWAWRKREVDRVLTCLVEVKTSRSDFQKDFKWDHPVPTDLAYLAIPKGMIAPEEYPRDYGILEYEDAKGLTHVRPPVVFKISAEQQRTIILNIAIRRDHHTRYERFRESQKEQRLQKSANKTPIRIHRVIRAMTAVLAAKKPTVEECLVYHGIRDLDPDLIEEFRPFYGAAKEIERES